MLLEFTVGNFMSFKEPKTLTMAASVINEHKETNVFEVEYPQALRIKNINLLKSAVIYGANASGKSNLIKAIAFMKFFVLNSSKSTQISDKINVQRFLLSTETDKEPSYFETIFIHEGVRYRYGFEVNQMEVLTEWLFHAPKGKEAKLFIREGDKFEIGSKFKEGRGLQGKTRENALFISVAAQFNGEISTKVLEWFGQKLRIISGIDDKRYAGFTFKKMKDDSGRKDVLKFLSFADLDIKDIKFETYDIEDKEIPDKVRERFLQNIKSQEGNGKVTLPVREISKLVSLHDKYNKENQKYELVAFDFGKESEGTQKLFAMAGLITSALKRGYVLFVDELDSRLHPVITRSLVELFNSNDTNKANSQLIFATHDSNLLTNSLFRRDQIWFTEKNRYGATDLYSLVEYKVRADASFSKDYILGKYGAIPLLGDRKIFIG